MHAVRSVLPLILAAAVSAHSATGTSQYAGQESRSIKALSPAEVEGFLQGSGMGLARAAELNGYPGPKHVLELGDELGLSAKQISDTRTLHARMLAAARELGKELVDAEKALDDLFRNRDANETALAELLSRIGDLQARLRGVHLSAHIEQTALLSPAQIEKYAHLRGYAGGHGHDHPHGGHVGHGR